MIGVAGLAEAGDDGVAGLVEAGKIGAVIVSPPWSSDPIHTFSDPGSPYGSFACTSLLTTLKSISPASGRFFSAPITLPMSFFVAAPVS